MKPLATLAATGLALSLNTTFAEDVKVNWDKHCASCHGKDGRGQTKAGRLSGVDDLTDPEHQATLKDEKMFTSVKDGLKRGSKEKMKPFKDTLNDNEIQALIVHVRAFKK